MKFARKYILIDQDNYERLANSKSNSSENNQDNLFEHPDVKAAKLEHKRMERIADDDTLTDSQKLQQHSQTLKRYLENFKDAVDVSKTQAILGRDTFKNPEEGAQSAVNGKDAEPSIGKAAVKNETEVYSQATPKQRISNKLTAVKIVGKLPTHVRKKGRSLLRDIKKIKSLKWTDDGSVLYHGTPLKGSDINQLVSDAIGATSKKSSKLAVRRKFNQILEDNGVLPVQSGGKVEYSHFRKIIPQGKWINHHE